MTSKSIEITAALKELIAKGDAVTVDDVVTALNSTDKLRVLQKFDGSALMAMTDTPSGSAIGVVLDTESTGKDASKDKLIELAIVAFSYDRETGRVLSVLHSNSYLQDPGIPIPPEATKVNRITDDMVAGQVIDQDLISMLMSGVELVIAHSSVFDRQMVERELPNVQWDSLPWACSLTEVDWLSMGLNSSKLEFIASAYGFYYDAHRAEIDCLALLNILSKPPLGSPQDGPTVLTQLIAAHKKESRRVWAVAAPFDAKDLLAARGYRWSPGNVEGTEKAWWTVVAEEALEAELQWLHENVYGRRSFSLPVDKLDAFYRFSTRRNRMPRVIYPA